MPESYCITVQLNNQFDSLPDKLKFPNKCKNYSLNIYLQYFSVTKTAFNLLRVDRLLLSWFSSFSK